MFAKLSSWSLVVAVAAGTAFAGSTGTDPQTEGGTDLDFSNLETEVSADTGSVETITTTVVLDTATTQTISQQLAELDAAEPGSPEAQQATVTIITTLVDAGAISVSSMTPEQQVTAANLIAAIIASTGGNARLQALLDELQS